MLFQPYNHTYWLLQWDYSNAPIIIYCQRNLSVNPSGLVVRSCDLLTVVITNHILNLTSYKLPLRSIQYLYFCLSSCVSSWPRWNHIIINTYWLLRNLYKHKSYKCYMLCSIFSSFTLTYKAMIMEIDCIAGLRYVLDCKNSKQLVNNHHLLYICYISVADYFFFLTPSTNQGISHTPLQSMAISVAVCCFYTKKKTHAHLYLCLPIHYSLNFLFWKESFIENRYMPYGHICIKKWT